MDVVKANIELIGGTIDIASEAGRGTTFTLKIPLTLAIVAALIVIVDGRRFAIPQAAVLELVRVEPGTDRGIDAAERQHAFATLYVTLVTLARLVAPVLPFLSEVLSSRETW